MNPFDPPLTPLFEADEAPRPLWKRALLLGGAALFMVLGVIGWLVPVVTGIPFYVVGFALLGAASPRTIHALNRLEARLPQRWRVALRVTSAKLLAAYRARRDRKRAMTSASTDSKGSALQPNSERALPESQRK
ncbi:MAG: hypothetical protein JNN27_05895 [Planctomycetes bacterium]|nr:hypothetical protein [Planctomycetota bacterium]